MLRKYKNSGRQELYTHLVRLGSPDALSRHGIWGALLDAFTCGYKGLSLPPRFKAPQTLAYVAYYAGKDAAKQVNAP